MPSSQDWLDVLALSGPEGGMEATAVAWDDMMQLHKEIADQMEIHELDMNHKSQAKRDVKRLRFHALTTTKRKSSPKHSLPPEVIAMCLAPAQYLDLPANTVTLGLGLSRKPELDAPKVWEAFTLGYQLINKTTLTPLNWHLSWGAALDKPAAQRTPSLRRGKGSCTGWTSRARLSSARKWQLQTSLAPTDPSLPTRHRASSSVAGGRLASSLSWSQSIS